MFKSLFDFDLAFSKISMIFVYFISIIRYFNLIKSFIKYIEKQLVSNIYINSYF